MLKIKMQVRCPVDSEDADNPRDFALAQIISMDDLAETATVKFTDIYQIRQFYPMPEEYTYPVSQLRHARIHQDAVVRYRLEPYVVKGCMENKEDGYYYYFLTAIQRNYTVKVCETSLRASFNDGEVNPLVQLSQYEFQNPMWFFGRRNVSQTMQTIENAIYGFKELSGCKIYLKPYQLKTVMRCLKQRPCRNMIADEVGLGKTIEAASVLKIYMVDHRLAKIGILVPDTLTEQWRTELAFKFNIFEDPDRNGNRIRIVPFSKLLVMKTEFSYDFLIVDEVHQCLKNETVYERLLELSKNAKNVLMLSATPVQDRQDEYYRLINLIQPEKYGSVTKEAFFEKLSLQSKIVRGIYDLLSDLEDYMEEIDDADGMLSEDAEDVFYDELQDDFNKIKDLIHDKTFSEMVGKVDIQADEFGVQEMRTAIAYVCEHYQLERCIIRNRRNVLDNDEPNERRLCPLPYDLTEYYNNAQLLAYRGLSDWMESELHTAEDIEAIGRPLISALFSSASAFYATLKETKGIPDELNHLAERYAKEEQRELKNLRMAMEDPYEHPSRMVKILDYIDQEAYDKKILLFTNMDETFQLYREALSNMFGETCCFFHKEMEVDQLELQTYRFQTDSQFRIMLSDETGGEGRNFQNADILIHIDLPWNANVLEQRIGRMDRIGRAKNRPVLSVVPYASESLEEDLFRVWNEGLHIFEQSQSGLEIIMNEIDEKIIQSVSEDMKYGLANMVPNLIEDVKRLKETVKKEQHFDVAGYQYQTLNIQLDRSVRLYTEHETELFTESMLSWAKLAGFQGKMITENVVRFDAASFSVKSAQNTRLVPPNMKVEIEQRLNQLQNRVRALNGERDIVNDPNFIQGTFERNKALSNDYLHFFAPGDAIFDSIVQNALYSYKGRCSAIAVSAGFNWSGLIFTWNLRPDESVLLEQELDVRILNQYRGFLSGKQLTNAIPVNAEDWQAVPDVLKIIQNLSTMRSSELRSEVEHLGGRKPQNKLLDIKDRYGCSDVEWFQSRYPKNKWKTFVRESYQRAKEAAVNQLREKSNLKGLHDELLNTISAAEATSSYFQQEEEIQKLREQHKLIWQAFRKSKVELDAVCFVRLVKLI